MAIYRSSLRSRRKNFKQKIILYIVLGCIGLVVLGFIASFGLFAWYARDLPSPGKLAQTSESSTVFYDRTDKVLFEMYKDKNRVPVDFANISQSLKDATISIEDKNFYSHKGFSEAGMVRAALNILMGRGLQSGSTITQQLVKNTLLSSEQTASRKIRELILAMEVERRYSKDEILGMYLNEAPYGGTYYGIGSAARGYFDKSPKDLTLVESAILAGLPQSPSVYSPFSGRKDAWKNRAKAVLRRMREDGKITRQQEDESLKKLDSVKFSQAKIAMNAPHFVFYVRDLLENDHGSAVLDKGLKVKTTIDLDVQNTVQSIVKTEIEKLQDLDVGNGAAVVLDNTTGEIIAMVGSYDYNDPSFGNFNAALGLRQPGSTVKPITYALALEKGYTASSVVMDVDTVFAAQGGKDYKPVNYDGKFRGPVQLRFALANSLNIPAVKVLAIVGVRDFLQRADAMGLSTLAPTAENVNKFGLSVTLGGGDVRLLDLTNAFSVFARGGTYMDVRAITEVKDARGRTVTKASRNAEKRVMPVESAFIISHILSDNNARAEAFGTSSLLRIPGKTVAVKTGTTNDKRDNWAVGYTRNITVGVWVGNNDNSVMNQKVASGTTGASPIWHNIMGELLKTYTDGIIDKPDTVEAMEIDAFLGGLPKDGQPNRSEYFVKATEPKTVSPFYQKLKLERGTGKLANELQVRRGEYEEKEFYVITERDPVSPDGKNRWQEGIDSWAAGQGEERYKYPKDTSSASADSVVVSIREPNGDSQVSGGTVTIRARIVSMEPVKIVKYWINGQERKVFDGDRDEISDEISLPDGVYELKVAAWNTKDNGGDSTIRFGVNMPANTQVTPTNTP